MALIFMWSLVLETDAEPKRRKNRNRNSRRRNNDYSDDEDESLLGQFSGDSYADFMERYYGGNNGRDHSRSEGKMRRPENNLYGRVTWKKK